MDNIPEFESIRNFSKRVGLAENLIRKYAKSGRIPTVQSGRKNLHVHVEAALIALEQIAKLEATERAMYAPVTPIAFPVSKRVLEKRKYRGRPPDAVRLAKKLSK
jgi:endonuclease V-like protein UPF0215 family